MKRSLLTCAIILSSFAWSDASSYTVLWEGAVPLLFCGSYDGTDCIPFNPIADLDGDLVQEMVVVRSKGQPSGWLHVRIYDAVTGSLEFEMDDPSWPGSFYFTTKDLDGDRVAEVIVSNGESRIMVIGSSGPAHVDNEPQSPPEANRSSIRPNPFNSPAVIDYALPRGGNAKLLIYDASGRLVRTLADAKLNSGKHSATWDGRGDAGNQAPSGTYFYSVTLDGEMLDKGKAVILR